MSTIMRTGITPFGRLIKVFVSNERVVETIKEIRKEDIGEEEKIKLEAKLDTIAQEEIEKFDIETFELWDQSDNFLFFVFVPLLLFISAVVTSIIAKTKIRMIHVVLRRNILFIGQRS